jgi:hypothetical protein
LPPHPDDAEFARNMPNQMFEEEDYFDAADRILMDLDVE